MGRSPLTALVPLLIVPTLIITTSACGVVDRDTATALPAGTVQVLHSPSLAQLPGGRQADAAGLVGGHALLHVQETGVLSRVDEFTARRWGLPEPVRADDGDELVWASLSLGGRQWRNSDRDVEWARVAVLAGGVRTTITVPLTASADPTAYADAVLVSVPAGEPVLVQLTDDGVTQSIDVRSGRRVDDARGLYPRPVQEHGFRYAGNGTIDGTPVRFQAFADGFSLEPWVPGLGWARDGHAWLAVKRFRISGGAPAAQLTLDPALAVSVLAPDGRTHPADTDRIPVTVSSGIAPHGLYIEVPATFRYGVLRLSPAALKAGLTPVTWQNEPAPADFPIGLS
ncbi:hypothetical protein J2S43_002097 [Catenuloplanes nepalensis]|uniref:Lipoprotein n=1 Tax=Catenuloplanes nepalensis TaxID=587533 RepID=A0ABT9MQ91_9ACTN|nr:hypothetical protein [Catenuloplanes nepalensis]MDP9793585.1 hypothetical protein [Catenuloplanes nepalensis]